MATLSKGKTFTNGETVTPQKLHELVDLGAISGIVNADIAAGAAIADSKLAQISTAGKVLPAAVQGTAVVTADPRLSDARVPVPHGHAISDTTGLEAALNGKQAAGSYAPSTGIAQSAVTNLTTDLAGKAASSHTHDDRYYTETEIDTKLSGLPVSGHTHTIANVTGLQTALDGKQASGSYAPATGIAQSAVTNLTTDLFAKASSLHMHGNITNAGAIGSTASLPVITGASGVLQAGSFGTTAGTFCQGNDSRLSDSRFPTYHTHSAEQITSGNLSNDRLFATSANAVNNLVLRDANGNFSAGTITAALSGNATNVSGTVALANGGTGATNASAARTNLGLGNVAHIDGTPGGASGSPSAGSAGKIVTRDSARGFFAGRVQVTSETLNYGLDSEVDIIPGNVKVIKGTGVAQTSPNLLLGYSYDSSSGVNFIKFWRNGFDIGAITQSGTTGVAYNTSSDYRLKTNIEPLTAAVSRLLQIPVHRFNWLADPTGPKVDGFLAHEAQAIVPESVTGHKDEVDAEGKPIHQGIDQSKLVPLLVAAVQELAARVAALEAR